MTTRTIKRHGLRPAERGVALYVTLLAGVVLMGMGAATLTVSLGTSSENKTAQYHMKRQYLAESGIRLAIHDLRLDGDGNLGTESDPIAFGEGAFFTVTTDRGDGTFAVRSTGTAYGYARTKEVVVRAIGDAFDHAVFAGNSSEDPNYVLGLGGVGLDADLVDGDVYSGGSIAVLGDADITGRPRAAGEVQGVAGDSGSYQPIPDVGARNYEVNHDVNVAVEFAAYGTYEANALGGSAFQVPENQRSHIFRKNPSDRATETGSTVKEDYFLEDPYELVRQDLASDGSDACEISLSGNGEPGPSGNKLVYYIDGNLWIHSKRTMSFILNSGTDESQVTIVVKGNIYMSDNVFYGDADKDGLALIAVKDDAVADSGNIYFGDPAFGTLERMSAFMYAENDFYDNDLNASGSADVVVNGMMSAGNHLSINRDWGTAHSRLEVGFDDRISQGLLDMPGLPRRGVGRVEYQVLAWNEVSEQAPVSQPLEVVAEEELPVRRHWWNNEWSEHEELEEEWWPGHESWQEETASSGSGGSSGCNNWWSGQGWWGGESWRLQGWSENWGEGSNWGSNGNGNGWGWGNGNGWGWGWGWGW